MNTPSDGKTLVIHKEGEEGTIEIDAMTGQITGPEIDQRPDWADQLAAAMLVERVGFYEQRVGPKMATKHLEKGGPIAFQDFSWLGLDEEGAECEIEADLDYRTGIVAELLGIDRDAAEGEADFGKTLADISMAHDTKRSDAQVADLTAADKQGFGVAEDKELPATKTGT